MKSIIFKDIRSNKLIKINISKLPITVGRFPDNTIVIEDLLVSRRHFIVYVEDDVIMINDLNSKNGTYLNKQTVIAPGILKNNDIIKIGKTRILIQIEDK